MREVLLNANAPDKYLTLNQKSDLFYHEILLPECVSEKFKDSSYLWNAAENAERRKDSQVQKSQLLLFPIIKKSAMKIE